ncbi:hypothetical protein H4582DRAFT_1935330 [Lactarius indigo]|nr:hypothetical protein H4582DRAFT_1935330 [Lactarius indigo]
MLVSSKNFPQSTNSSTRHTLVLRHGSRNVLVLLPRTYQELLAITRSVFSMARSSTFVFETSDLDICQDVAVEIHPATWEAVALSLSSLVVKERNLGSSRARGQRDNATLHHSHNAHGNSPLVTRHPHDAPSGSSNDQSDNGLTPATSYDDVPDSMPTDDFAEEELGSYDDDFNYTPAPPKGKGKAKATSRARIESDDDDDEDDDDGRAEDAGGARGPGWFVPHPVQSTAIKADPSFSILPLSSPKRVGVPATSPQRLSVHGGLFSPRAKSGVNNLAPAPVLSDEEQVEARSPVKPLRKPVQLVPDASPLTDGTPKEPAAPTTAALKDAQHEYPPQPKFNPQLKVPAQFAPAPASAPAPAQTPTKASQPFDKILITIRHPPTEKENKFKVKSTHLVGRVLTSACSAFGLNPTGATLMAWTEEDGLEMTSSCTNDASMGSVATDGAIFIIELAK